MSRFYFGLFLLVLAACGDRMTVWVETPGRTRFYDRDELRAATEERYAMRVGQLGTASCYVDFDQDETCGPVNFERCPDFEISDPSSNIEVLEVVQVVGEPARLAFIARAAGSGRLVLRAEGMDRPLLVEVTEHPSP